MRPSDGEEPPTSFSPLPPDLASAPGENALETPLLCRVPADPGTNRLEREARRGRAGIRNQGMRNDETNMVERDW